jgi:glycosyltransferase involved in cell wall biosynthesis
MPGAPETPTGGYVYNRRMIDGLVGQGWAVDVRTLDPSFPGPTPAALAHAAHVLAAAPAGMPVLVDGLAFGAMPDIIEREAARLRIAALVHLPLAADVTFNAETAAQLAASERRALHAAALVIVTGKASLALLARHHVGAQKIVIVEPGTARVPIRRCDRGARVMLLSVATLHPGKGHEILLDALAPLRQFDWHLVCAGSLTRHPETTARVREAIARLGLGERVSLVGALDETRLSRCYARADVFVLATLQETYGMAVAEAVAHGLPIVATTTGAIPELVGDEAGLLVPPGDSAALSDALRRVISDAALRDRLMDGTERARNRLPTWDQASRNMADALERLVTHG